MKKIELREILERNDIVNRIGGIINQEDIKPNELIELYEKLCKVVNKFSYRKINPIL